MPRVELLESFDDLKTSDLVLFYDIYGSGGESIVAPGRSGAGNCLQLAGATASVRMAAAENETQFDFGFAFKCPSFWSTESLCFVADPSGAAQLALKYNGDGSIGLYRGATLIATSAAGVIPQDAWVHLEFQGEIHPTAGYFQIRKNGAATPVLSFAGNTQGTASGEWRYVNLFRTYNSLFFDDWFVISGHGGAADWAGDATLAAYYPAGAGSAAEWAASGAGGNFAQVDENPQDGDTSYVYSATAGQRDLYAFQDMAAFAGQIRAASVRTFARKDDAGGREIRPICKSGATIGNGAIVALSASYAGYRDVFETDPATGARWTRAGINGAEFGVELVS